MNRLFGKITLLKGVGEKRGKLLQKLGVETPYDLLYHFPRRYVDYSKTRKILDVQIGENGCVLGEILEKHAPKMLGNGLYLYKVTATDGETRFSVSVFGNMYLFDGLTIGESYYIYGKVTEYNGQIQLAVNNVLSETAENLIQPVYRLTAGLTAAMAQTNVRECLKIADDELDEFLPLEILEKYELCGIKHAILNIHFPMGYDEMDEARRRLGFDELLFLMLGMRNLKYRGKEQTSYVMEKKKPLDFPFELTSAQERAIADIAADMEKSVPMNRLLQGDVGSGKTAVAAAACNIAARNGCQTALMVPTEILAAQHYKTLTDMLPDSRIGLLTGSLPLKEKNAVKKAVAQNEYDVIVGTHALFQKTVEYANLGLVITDEQHRFGVNQRAMLSQKGNHCHRLVMSATPIPRTLGLVIYGDLDVTVLDELPKGRKPIDTFAVTGKLRQRAYGFIKKQLDEGRQAYFICPAIEIGGTVESDDDFENESPLKAVKAYADEISDGFFRGYRTAVLHGKLSAEEKEEVMARFKSGEIQILVSTTVVEVGVDVPNANSILIENAERFGLSQIHQLRGRVGRGEAQSYCILITDNPTEECKARMKIISKTNDGFKIAEEDLKQRGPGDFFGKAQHGLPRLKIADIATDMELLFQTQEAANDILDKDPTLSLPQHHALKIEVMRLFSGN